MKDEEVAKLILKQYLANDLIKVVLDYHDTFPPKYIFKKLTKSSKTNNSYKIQLMEIDLKPNTTYNIQYHIFGYIRKPVEHSSGHGFVDIYSKVSTTRSYLREVNISLTYSSDYSGFIFLPASKNNGKIYIEYSVYDAVFYLDEIEILAIPLD